MNNSTKRFTDRVENYIKYRPDYPREIISFLQNESDFTSQLIVADIGSGTGISTKLFLENGNRVKAVEPNDAMRKAAEEYLRDYPGFVSIAGTAENTELAGNSIDVIVAGQAFHWFDPAETKKEFQRIGKASALVILIWNERQAISPFGQAYEELLLQYATDYNKVGHRNISDDRIAAFYQPHSYQCKIFYNEQRLDFNGLKGRLLSSSYVPNVGHPSYENMITDLQELYEKFGEAGNIRLEYETKVYTGKIN